MARGPLLHALLLGGVAVSTGFVPTPLVSSRFSRTGASSSVRMAYKVPDATQEDWVNSYARLYKERIVYLGQEIDDLVINQIIAVMLFADAEDSTRPQYLYINSPGGSVIAGASAESSPGPLAVALTSPGHLTSGVPTDRTRFFRGQASPSTTRLATSARRWSRATSGWRRRWRRSSWARASVASASPSRTRA